MAKREKKPKDAPLPTMEDHGIPELEALADRYSEIRDDRIALNKEEADLKEKVRAAMHKHDKTFYKHNGIVISLIAGEEDVKVKVARPKADPDEE